MTTLKSNSASTPSPLPAPVVEGERGDRPVEPTPGPWFAEVGRNNDGNRVIGIGPDADVADRVIAEVPPSGDTFTAEDWANAHCLKAAWDMRAALVADADDLEFLVNNIAANEPLDEAMFERICTALTRSRAAITKARAA